jgi:hypothetical protein
MRNSWLKKNPYMSLWLSGANAAANSAKSHGSRQAKRQATTAMTNATRDIFALWAHALANSPVRKRNIR